MKKHLLLAGLCALTLALGSCASDPDAGAPEPPRGIVLVVVDALRADHLGAYGYGARDTSPQIDRWAERGLLFERAWATSSWTLPSFGSILTGHLPSAHGAGVEVEEGSDAASEVAAARNFVVLPETIPTLARLLAAQGFDTGAFVANPFLDPRFGLGRGFAYYDHDDAGNEQVRRAEQVVDAALGWIDERGGRPFFLMVHLMDPHLDYDAPPPFAGTFTSAVDAGRELPVRRLWPIRNGIAEMGPAERDFIAAAYDEEIAYVDAEIGRLLAGLEQRGLIADGIVALTADHGEELFEHGGFEHGHSMHEEVLRVPMILWGRGVTPGRETLPVSLIDVAPTLLQAAGLPPEALATEGPAAGDGSTIATVVAALPGVSLLDAARSTWPAQRTVVAERLLYGSEAKAIVSWPYKAIISLDSGAAQLFDLEADAEERHDLAARRPEVLNTLLAELAARLAEAEALGVAVEAELDEELLRRLRALGYIR